MMAAMVVALAAVLALTAHISGIDAAPASGSSGDSPRADYVRRNPLVNRTIPCSQEDRRCFQEKTIRYLADGNCYHVRQRGPCGEGQWLVADKAEALGRGGGGHVVGTCTADHQRACPPLRVLMAADQRCVLLPFACGNGGWRVAFDVFGEGECVSPEDSQDAALPTVVADGSCKVVPSDLDNRLYALAVKSRVPCLRDYQGNCVQVVELPEAQNIFD